MNDQRLRLWPYHNRRKASDCSGAIERRQWVRFILPDLVTRLSWRNGSRAESHLVSLVNVSANGTAVIVDARPPIDQTCQIQFDNGGVTTGPIMTKLVSIEPADGNRYLVKLTFEAEQTTKTVIRHQIERRAWQRVVPIERRVCLTWQVGDETCTVEGEMLNISGGGAAVQTDVQPPRNQPVWLSVGPAGQEVDRAECRLVGFRHNQPGKLIARFAFVDLCPLQLYQAALRASN